MTRKRIHVRASGISPPPPPSPTISNGQISRVVESAVSQAAAAASAAAAKAATSAMEAALAQVAESIRRTTPAHELARTIEAAFSRAVEATAPKVIEGALTSALAPVNEAVQKLMTLLSRTPGPSVMKTYFLPWLGDPFSQAVRVGTAGDEPYEVVVRCVAPPGSFAVFSFDANELNTMDLPVIAPGVTGPPTGGDVLVIPGGQFQIIRLRPKMGLFAKGNIGPGAAIPPEGVVISVTGGDFTAGLTATPYPSALVSG